MTHQQALFQADEALPNRAALQEINIVFNESSDHLFADVLLYSAGLLAHTTRAMTDEEHLNEISAVVRTPQISLARISSGLLEVSVPEISERSKGS